MKSPLPIACTLSSDELRARRGELLPGLAARAHHIEPVADGVRLHFTPTADTLVDITRVVDAERHCCKFLGFTIAVAPDTGPITLTVTAPADAQALLAELTSTTSTD